MKTLKMNFFSKEEKEIISLALNSKLGRLKEFNQEKLKETITTLDLNEINKNEFTNLVNSLDFIDNYPNSKKDRWKLEKLIKKLSKRFNKVFGESVWEQQTRKKGDVIPN